MGGAVAALEPVQIVSILVKAGMYVSVLLAAGSAINLVLLRELDTTARSRLRLLAAVSALVGIVFSVLNIPLRAAFLSGSFAGAIDPVMLGIVTFSPLGYSVEADVIGLAAITAIAADRQWTRWLATAGVVLVAASFAMRGHAIGEPRFALGALFVIHILAASFWIGGFYPLHDMVQRGATGAARTVERFGQAALVMVGLLVVAGVSLLWLLTGDPLAAVSQPWGRLVAIKLMIVSILLALAALNKLRLTPILAATGDGRPLLRSIRWEMATFVLILVITAIFTSLFAPEHAATSPV
ncbi:MAG: CopD family protein [Celeribacter sp.]